MDLPWITVDAVDLPWIDVDAVEVAVECRGVPWSAVGCLSLE